MFYIIAKFIFRLIGSEFIRSLNKIEVEIKKPIYCSRQTNKDKEIVERVVESFIKEIY